MQLSRKRQPEDLGPDSDWERGPPIHSTATENRGHPGTQPPTASTPTAPCADAATTTSPRRLGLCTCSPASDSRWIRLPCPAATNLQAQSRNPRCPHDAQTGACSNAISPACGPAPVSTAQKHPSVPVFTTPCTTEPQKMQSWGSHMDTNDTMDMVLSVCRPARPGGPTTPSAPPLMSCRALQLRGLEAAAPSQI